MARSATKIVLAGAAGLVVLFASDNVSLTNSSSLVAQAEARVGRPLSPVSVAGVARRNTRRAVGVGVVGAAAVGAAATRRCYMTQNGQMCE
jgi:multisubunit Na+/H+ antiporter MnhB subunit